MLSEMIELLLPQNPRTGSLAGLPFLGDGYGSFAPLFVAWLAVLEAGELETIEFEGSGGSGRDGRRAPCVRVGVVRIAGSSAVSAASVRSVPGAADSLEAWVGRGFEAAPGLVLGLAGLQSTLHPRLTRTLRPQLLHLLHHRPHSRHPPHGHHGFHTHRPQAPPHHHQSRRVHLL